MPENYEVVYTHSSGATATFVRQDGELDALAKGLDAGQFWVFKNVKALLVRNDEGDLQQANRLMSEIGFTARVRTITTAQPAPARESVFAEVGVPEEHGGIHMPGPSYWPLLLGISAFIAFSGFIALPITYAITAIGLVLVFICMVGWGLEKN